MAPWLVWQALSTFMVAVCHDIGASHLRPLLSSTFTSAALIFSSSFSVFMPLPPLCPSSSSPSPSPHSHLLSAPFSFILRALLPPLPLQSLIQVSLASPHTNRRVCGRGWEVLVSVLNYHLSQLVLPHWQIDVGNKLG